MRAVSTPIRAMFDVRGVRECLVVLLALWALASGALAQPQVFFVRSDALPGGNGATRAIDSPDGTHAFGCWEDLLASVEFEPGDVVYHRGEFVGEPIDIRNVEGLSLLPDPESSSLTRLHGGVPVSAFGDNAGGAWPVHDAVAAEAPITVTEDYREDVDGSVTTVAGAYYGHLRRVVTLAECQATPGSWCFDGTLYVHASDSSDPRSNGRMYRVGLEGSALRITNGTDCTIAGFEGVHWSDMRGASKGMTAYLVDSVGCTIRDCISIDSGWHAFGAAGSFTVDNTIENCVALGMNWDPLGTLSGSETGAGPFVFAGVAAGGTNPENAGSRGTDLLSVMYPLLGPDGQPLVDADHPASSFYGTAFRSHGNIHIPMDDMEWRRCVLETRIDETAPITAFGAGFASRPIGDPLRIGSYAVRVFDSHVRNGKPGIGTNIGVVRTRFDARQAEFVPGNGAVVDVQSRWGVSENLFEACSFVGRFRDESPGVPWFGIGHNSVPSFVRLVACSFHTDDTGDGGPAGMLFRFRNWQANVTIRNTVYARSNPGWLALSDSNLLTASNFDVQGLWTSNIQTNRFCSGGWDQGDEMSVRRRSDWDSTGLAQINAETDGGVYDVTPEFESPLTAWLRPAPGSNLGATTWPQTGLDHVRGLNRGWFSGHYGAHQFGLHQSGGGSIRPGDASRLSGPTTLGTERFLSRLIRGDSDADLNGDGATDVRDAVIHLGLDRGNKKSRPHQLQTKQKR